MPMAEYLSLLVAKNFSAWGPQAEMLQKNNKDPGLGQDLQGPKTLLGRWSSVVDLALWWTFSKSTTLAVAGGALPPAALRVLLVLR